MADFSKDPKYKYLWQNAKFKDLASTGSPISIFTNDVGYVTSADSSSFDTKSFVTTSSFNSYTGSNTSQFAGTSSFALTASYLSGSVSNAISASYAQSASYAENSLSSSFSHTASYVTPLNQNVIITGSIYIPNSSHSIYFSGSDAPSRLTWNDIDGTLDLGLKGGNVTLQIGQETVARVVNKTDADLLEADFKIVRVRSVSEGGAQGQRLAVVLAQADNDADSTTTLGVVTETIIKNQEGFITIFGQVRQIDTTGAKSYGGLETWVDGDVLYLSPTHAGYLTNIKPISPQHLVIIGYVEYAHQNNGKIFVKVDNGWEVGELHDVLDSTTSSSYGDLFIKSGSVWSNSKQLTGSYGLTGSLTATSFTGSLLGTSSYSINTISASYAQTASYVLNAVSASYATTASNSISASYAQSGNGIFSGSFSGSYIGNGSGLTGISQPPSILRNITSTDTFTTAQETINCTSGTFIINLPTAVGIQGTTYTLVNSGTGVITLDANGTETINGSLTIDLTQYISRTVQSDGSNWIII